MLRSREAPKLQHKYRIWPQINHNVDRLCNFPNRHRSYWKHHELLLPQLYSLATRTFFPGRSSTPGGRMWARPFVEGSIPVASVDSLIASASALSA